MFALCSFPAQVSRFKSRDVSIVCSSWYASQAIKLHGVEPSRGFGVSFDLRLGSGDWDTDSVVHLCMFIDSSKATHVEPFCLWWWDKVFLNIAAKFIISVFKIHMVLGGFLPASGKHFYFCTLKANEIQTQTPDSGWHNLLQLSGVGRAILSLKNAFNARMLSHSSTNIFH